MSTPDTELFGRYVGHVRQALEAVAKTEASSSAYQEGTAALVRQALDLATRRFDRVCEDYKSLIGEDLAPIAPVPAAAPEEAEGAEGLLAEAGAELRRIEQTLEALRTAVPVWERVNALTVFACGNASYVDWRDTVKAALEASRTQLLSEDPAAIDRVRQAMETAEQRYASLRKELDAQIDEVSDTLSRSGSLIRSGERAVDAAFRRGRTGGGRALKNAMSFGIIGGAIGYVLTFLYALTKPEMKGAEVARAGAMVVGAVGFVIGAGVGWFRFMRPAKRQLVAAEAKLARAERAVHTEEARLAELRKDAKVLPYDAHGLPAVVETPSEEQPTIVGATTTRSVSELDAPPTSNNAASIGDALTADLER